MKFHYWVFSSILTSDTIAQILLKEDPEKKKAELRAMI